jgi:multiple sugar transport system permease protein
VSDARPGIVLGRAADRRPAGRARSRRTRSTRVRVAMAFQIPSLLVLLGVVAFPLGYTLWLSFRSYSLVIPGRTGQWIGLGNFDRLLHDAQFHHALELTGLYTVIAVAIEVVLGVAAAFALNAVGRGRRLLTSLMLIPMILAPLIIGLMFNFLLNAQFGLFTYLVDTLGLPLPQNILGSPTWSFPALIFTDVWEWTPFIALITLAGIQALPGAPLEAARVEGASSWQIATRVILPMLRPILLVAVLFRAAEAVREFDKVYILTGGGPGSSTMLNDLFTYRVSFVEWDLSYGAAIGIFMFALTLFVAFFFFVVVERRTVR